MASIIDNGDTHRPGVFCRLCFRSKKDSLGIPKGKVLFCFHGLVYFTRSDDRKSQYIIT